MSRLLHVNALPGTRRFGAAYSRAFCRDQFPHDPAEQVGSAVHGQRQPGSSRTLIESILLRFDDDLVLVEGNFGKSENLVGELETRILRPSAGGIKITRRPVGHRDHRLIVATYEQRFLGRCLPVKSLRRAHRIPTWTL